MLHFFHLLQSKARSDFLSFLRCGFFCCLLLGCGLCRCLLFRLTACSFFLLCRCGLILHILAYQRIGRIPCLFNRYRSYGWFIVWAYTYRILEDLDRGADRAVVIYPLGILRGQTDTAKGTLLPVSSSFVPATPRPLRGLSHHHRKLPPA